MTSHDAGTHKIIIVCESQITDRYIDIIMILTTLNSSGKKIVASSSTRCQMPILQKRNAKLPAELS